MKHQAINIQHDTSRTSYYNGLPILCSTRFKVFHLVRAELIVFFTREKIFNDIIHSCYIRDDKRGILDHLKQSV